MKTKKATTDLQDAIRENLSPEGITAIVAHLRAANPKSAREAGEDHIRAMNELRWFADTLQEMVGIPEYNRLLDEIEL